MRHEVAYVIGLPGLPRMRRARFTGIFPGLSALPAQLKGQVTGWFRVFCAQAGSAPALSNPNIPVGRVYRDLLEKCPRGWYHIQGYASAPPQARIF